MSNVCSSLDRPFHLHIQIHQLFSRRHIPHHRLKALDNLRPSLFPIGHFSNRLLLALVIEVKIQPPMIDLQLLRPHLKAAQRNHADCQCHPKHAFMTFHPHPIP